jgi:hypothetical protein
MKKTLPTLVMIFLFGSLTIAQSIPPDSLYFGQTPPGSIPQVFAPGIVSRPGLREATITFSPDGATVFFHIQFYPQPGTPYIMFATYTNDHWTTPDTIPFSIGRTAAEPSFAWSGNRIYMYATNAVNHIGIADLSYSEKQGSAWSAPFSMGDPPNSEAYQYHPCIVADTSVYFSSAGGQVCRSQYINGTCLPRVILPKPVNYFGSQTWGDPYVAPDESYMIIKQIRTEGFGQNDLYISYRKTDGTWTNPKNLGNIINTTGDELSGDITPDGLYMTYGRNNDLYWVSTGFIDSLRYTNFRPYVKNPIPNKTVLKGEWFSYTIPDTTFVDDDGNHTLIFGATLAGGDPLPSWLAFDTLTATFFGAPPEAKTLNIMVTATDTAGIAASAIFMIIVSDAVSIGQTLGQDEGVTVFPNPSAGVIYVSLSDAHAKPVTAEVSNFQGVVILAGIFAKDLRLDLSGNPKGFYLIRLHMGNEIVTRKMFLH